MNIEENENIEIYEDFDSMDLKENLLRGIFSYGYEKPSAIQQKAIVPLIKRDDIIAQAQSGTGKTATFSLGVLGNLDIKSQTTQALVLAHTRELALQINNVFTQIGSYLKPTIKLLEIQDLF